MDATFRPTSRHEKEMSRAGEVVVGDRRSFSQSAAFVAACDIEGFTPELHGRGRGTTPPGTSNPTGGGSGAPREPREPGNRRGNRQERQRR